MNRRCFYCGVDETPAKRLTRDHITPRSRGGDDSPANIALACLDCNSSKNRRTLEEYRVAEGFNQAEAPVIFAGEDPAAFRPRDVLFLSSRAFVQDLIAATLADRGIEPRPWVATKEKPPYRPPLKRFLEPGARALRRAAHRRRMQGEGAGS
ncbi:type II restriction endonuclease [Microcystis phage vB_MweS-yong2]|nr:type II restriction endonuclease [Microcystis phage vB_MweS-yong2]